MKVLITGGHFSPAYSVIKELKKEGHQAAVAGRRFSFEGEEAESLEYAISKKESLSFFEIKSGRFQRKFTIHTIPSILRTGRGFLDASRVISKFKPDIILTFGGYLAFPVAYTAFFQGIPVVLHEQTQKAGLAGKMIAPIAKKICVSFEGSLKFFPKEKVVFTGIPVREEIFIIDKKLKEFSDGPVIYVTGGSTGSHFINTLVLNSIDKLLTRFTVIHQTGDSLLFGDFAKLSERREKLDLLLKKKYILRKFIYPSEVGSVLNAADLVVSRAGINTVVELLSLSKMCLLIPLTSGQKDEQLDNAKFVRTVGIGDYMEEQDLDPSIFASKIKEMFRDRKDYELSREKTSDYIVNNAAARIVNVLEEVYAAKIG